MNHLASSIALILLLCLVSGPAPASAARYGVARSATPVLNTPIFSAVFGGRDGKTLKTDRCGQVRELEFIALPGTVFAIQSENRDGVRTIFKVTTDDYSAPSGTQLYLDSRFLEVRQEKPLSRRRQLPAREDILTRLRSARNSPYVWGGNLRGGERELLDLYFGGSLAGPAAARLSLAGLDCSGLLYQATAGWTPRNTSQLLSYGTGVAIAGKSAGEIAGLLEPLDLIVWNGHVLIVLDQETVIESRLECGKPGNGGVVMTPLERRLAEIMRTRRPMDSWPPGAGKQRDMFVVRRWYYP